MHTMDGWGYLAKFRSDHLNMKSTRLKLLAAALSRLPNTPTQNKRALGRGT